MGGAVLQILHFHCDHGLRVGSARQVLSRRKQVWGQRTVHSVCQQYELELNLKKGTSAFKEIDTITLIRFCSRQFRQLLRKRHASLRYLSYKWNSVMFGTLSIGNISNLREIRITGVENKTRLLEVSSSHKRNNTPATPIQIGKHIRKYI